MLGNVKVVILDGAIGGVPDSVENVAAMELTGVATANLTLGTPAVIYTLKEAEDLGITETGTNATAWRQIKEFFDGYRYVTGRDVAELYIMLVADTVTLTQMADYTDAAGAKSLVEYGQGRISLLGLSRTPDVSYVSTLTHGLDEDSLTALTKAEDLAKTFAEKQMPFRVLVEAREFTIANVGLLQDIKTMTNERAGLVMMSSKNDGSSSVGFALGVAAGLPVERKISRVKNGALPLAKVYIGDTLVDNINSLDTIHDKGYIVARKFPTKAGYYFNGDNMAVANSSDYRFLVRGRVIDKGQRITYNTFVNELDDEIETEGGKIHPAVIATLQELIEKNIKLGMTSNIDGVVAFIDPDQDVITLSKLKVVLKLQPKGYSSDIEVELGFTLSVAA